MKCEPVRIQLSFLTSMLSFTKMMNTKYSITYSSHRISHIFIRSISQNIFTQRWSNNRIWIAFSTTASRIDEIDISPTNPPPSKSKDEQQLFFNIPKRLRQKVVGIDDAVSLISNNDTISCSGFVAQGMPIRCRFVFTCLLMK